MEGKLYQINYQIGYFLVSQQSKEKEEIQSKKIIICINGLTGHLYNNQLFNRMIETMKNEYTIVLTQLRSSGSSFGMVTLKEDIEDLDLIISHILSHSSYDDIYLIGHSTGCQDIMKLLQSQLQKKYPIKKCILQAPVSDRDSMRGDKDIEKEIHRLEQLYHISLSEIVDIVNEFDKNNNTINTTNSKYSIEQIQQWKSIISSNEPSHYLYCNEYYLQQRRFISFFIRHGEDDYFSEDLTDNELKELFSCITIPCLFIFSLNDQYIPQTFDEYQVLIKRMKQSNANITIAEINDDHEVSHSLDTAISIISSYLSEK